MAVWRRLWTYTLILAFWLYGIVDSQMQDTEDNDSLDDDATNPENVTSPVPSTTAPDEIYRMDMIPTGTLPDNVYRELAWYGILQIQPIPASVKNRMVSRLIWQHAFGRPHVLLELNQGYQAPGLENRKTISEKGVLWARSQESKKQIILEAMRRGGNGITIRTVVGITQISEYMITSGISFHCENSKINRNLFQLVEKRTVIGACISSAGVISNGVRKVDECMEAEFANMEYSYGEGWVFCMGHGERDKQMGDDGKIDCGSKSKVLYTQVLDNCAIDWNVVIKFEYFGDIPRKELLQEQSICLTWTPCTIWYLYRLEPTPELPNEVTVTESCMPDADGCVGCMFSMTMSEADAGNGTASEEGESTTESETDATAAP